jgi:hypothetical protein
MIARRNRLRVLHIGLGWRAPHRMQRPIRSHYANDRAYHQPGRNNRQAGFQPSPQKHPPSIHHVKSTHLAGTAFPAPAFTNLNSPSRLKADPSRAIRTNFGAQNASKQHETAPKSHVFEHVFNVFILV